MAMATAMRPPLPPLTDQIHGSLSCRRPHLNPLQFSRRQSRERTRVSLSQPSGTVARAQLGQEERDAEESPPYSVLAAIRSLHNEIVVVDTPESRVLLLDSTHNVHSMLNKEEKWTDSYWDEFASLPAIIPEGPIAILGCRNGSTFDA